MVANRIFYAGAKLIDFKLEVIALTAVVMLVVLGPLLVFVPLTLTIMPLEDLITNSSGPFSEVR